MFDFSFYHDKSVLITGHTGFKGAWMCKVLLREGARITGYALKPPTAPSIFELCGLSERINSVEGDIRDLEHLMRVFDEVQPEIVIHMAAQPIVRESYRNPVYTYETNVMGTVNILECIRKHTCVKSFLNVTTDKVYLNKEWEWGYRENEELNGYDPYSNSKSCSELVTWSYYNSFFQEKDVKISTARAGNVIGGGDFAADRIVPDCIRAMKEQKEIIVRNPYSTRPYQHVLEPVCVYLMIAMRQYEDEIFAGSYNVGPDENDCYSTGDLTELFCRKWNASNGDGGNISKNKAGFRASWKNISDGGPHEANFLKLDCSKLKKTFGWHPVWNVETAMEKIVEWSKVYLENGDINLCTDKQIEEFLNS